MSEDKNLLRQLLIAGESSYIYESLGGLVKVCGQPRNEFLIAAEQTINRVQSDLGFDLHAALDRKIEEMSSAEYPDSSEGAQSLHIICALAPTAIDEIGKTHVLSRHGRPLTRS